MPNSFRGSKGGEVTARGVFSAILHRRPRLQRRGTGSPLLFFFLPGCRGRTKKSQFQYGKKWKARAKEGRGEPEIELSRGKGEEETCTRVLLFLSFLSLSLLFRTGKNRNSSFIRFPSPSPPPPPPPPVFSPTFPALFSLPFPLPSSKRGERFSFLSPSRFSLSRRAIPYDDDDAS